MASHAPFRFWENWQMNFYSHLLELFLLFSQTTLQRGFYQKMLCGLKMHFQISLHCWDKNSNFQPFKLFLRKNYPPNTVWAIKKLYLSVPQNMKVAWLTITFYKKSKDAHLWIHMSISSFCATFSEIAESTSKSTWFLIPTTIDYTLIII